MVVIPLTVPEVGKIAVIVVGEVARVPLGVADVFHLVVDRVVAD